MPDDELQDTGRRARRPSSRPGRALALAAAKRLLHTSLEDTLETHLAREAEAISAASGTSEGAEGIAAFVEKRKPDFNA